MIALEKDAGLWIATLNRPDKANALTPAMLERLVEIAQAATMPDSGARALILTGRGRIFSAGADLKAARAGLATSPLWERLSNAIAALPCLTIAALNGTLAGGAFGMALACDLRLAVPQSRFFYPVMKLGFLPQPSDPARLVALAGPATARLILMAGATLSAEEALRTGLVNRLCAPESLLDDARALCAASLEADPALAAQIDARITATCTRGA